MKYTIYKSAKGKRARFSFATISKATPIKPNIAPEEPKLMASRGNNINENRLPINPERK